MTNGAVPEAFGERVLFYSEIDLDEPGFASRNELLAKTLGKDAQVLQFAITPFDYFETPTGEIREQDAYSPHFQPWKWDIFSMSFFPSFLIGLVPGLSSRTERVKNYVEAVLKRGEYVAKVIENIYKKDKGAREAKGKALQERAEKNKELENKILANRLMGEFAPLEAYKKAIELGDFEGAQKLVEPAKQEYIEQKQKETGFEKKYESLLEKFDKLEQKYKRGLEERDKIYQKLKELADEIKKAGIPQPYFGGAPAAPWYRATQPFGGYSHSVGPIDLSEIIERLDKIEKRQQEYEAHFAVIEGM